MTSIKRKGFTTGNGFDKGERLPLNITNSTTGTNFYSSQWLSVKGLNSSKRSGFC